MGQKALLPLLKKTKPQSKMTRHLQQKHYKEEVAFALCYPPKSKKHSQMFDKLRNRGNLFHNIDVLQEADSELPAATRGRSRCRELLALLRFFPLKDRLWKHQQICHRWNNVEQETHKNRRRIQSAASALLLREGQMSQRCAKLLEWMNIDDVSNEVKSDPLIFELVVEFLCH